MRSPAWPLRPERSVSVNLRALLQTTASTTLTTLVAERSAASGSGLCAVTLAVLASGPGSAAAATRSPRTKTWLAGAVAAIEHDTLPRVPGAGVEHAHPAGAASDSKVVNTGSVSVNTTLRAVAGPALATVSVQATTPFGLTDRVRSRS